MHGSTKIRWETVRETHDTGGDRHTRHRMHSRDPSRDAGAQGSAPRPPVVARSWTLSTAEPGGLDHDWTLQPPSRADTRVGTGMLRDASS